jgi:iron complex outermembrane receptor protein
MAQRALPINIALFSSIMANLLSFVLLLSVQLSISLPAESSPNRDNGRSIRPADSTSMYDLPPVTVTAGLTKLNPALAPFSIAVLDATDITTLPVRAASDALAYVPGVDLRRRGPLGVQSDVTIRGGTFEQTAIMIEGMRLNDVQTGHNTFSIPLLPSDIERIEVVKGGAARALGAGAMDGAVNIILKRPGSVPTISLGLMGGDATYQEGRLSASAATGSIVHRLSAQAMRHGGWIPSSDVELQSILYTASTEFDDGKAQVLVGATNKVFGANGFYTPRFPEQWEHVTTIIAGATLEKSLSTDVDVRFRGLSRMNDDEFRLKRNDPKFYTNTHRTEQHLIQAGLTFHRSNGATSLLVEGGSDWINSSNLGTHRRLRGSVIVENVTEMKPLRITLGGGLLTFSDRAPLPTGGLDLSYRLDSESTSISILFLSLQINGRIPSYTDLYYRDPATTGNPLLRLETARTAELGYRCTTERMTISGAVFHRNGRDMIDYAIDTAGKATAANITTVNVTGLDVSAAWRTDVGALRHIRIGLVYQSLVSSSPARTRYIADNLRTQGILETRWQLPLDITATYIARVIERVTDPTIRVVHDVSLRKQISPFTITLEATNLSNSSYIETGWVPVPPRWARIGLDWSL